MASFSQPYRFHILFIYLLISTCSTLTRDKEVNCIMPGMVGPHHENVCKILKVMKEAKERHNTCRKVQTAENRLLLYGLPGNGKTLSAHSTARKLNYEFIKISATDVVEAYQGKGATKLELMLQEAKHLTKNTDKDGVVIFMDEVETLFANTTSEFRGEHLNSTIKVWTLLDDYEDDPKIFFIFATNNIEGLHTTLLDRFKTEQKIEILNPKLSKRKLREKSFDLL